VLADRVEKGWSGSTRRSILILRFEKGSNDESQSIWF
jgi:hypothetical protein